MTLRKGLYKRDLMTTASVNIIGASKMRNNLVLSICIAILEFSILLLKRALLQFCVVFLLCSAYILLLLFFTFKGNARSKPLRVRENENFRYSDYSYCNSCNCDNYEESKQEKKERSDSDY